MGKEIVFIQEEGYNYPIQMVELVMQNDFKKRLHEVKDFEVRDNDIMVCAYMKSGIIVCNKL